MGTRTTAHDVPVAPSLHYRRRALALAVSDDVEPMRLSPGFLVAAPALRDPNFARSVVLLIEHGTNGAIGFVVNRASSVTYAGLMKGLGIEVRTHEGATRVLQGGPVAQNTGWIVFDTKTHRSTVQGTVEVTPELGVSVSRELLEAIAAGEGPGRHLLVLGHALWATGQLEEELRQGVWIPCALDTSLIFDARIDERWALAMGIIGVNPGRIGSKVGEA